jgi:hypothetical protein
MWHQHRESIMFTIGLWAAFIVVTCIVAFGLFCHFAGRAEKPKPKAEDEHATEKFIG